MANFDVPGVSNIFATPPAKTKTYKFGLHPNGAHALVSTYAFMLRTARMEFVRSTHLLEVQLTRMPSGQDHASITWQRMARGDTLGRHAIAHLLDPRCSAGPIGTPLFSYAQTDPLAPWRSGKGKPRAGLTYFLEVQPVYRVGVDPFTESAAAMRAALEQFKASIQAIQDRHA